MAAVVAAAFLFSLTVEALQLFMMRGLFEWDDIFSNTLGAVTGIVLDQLICRMPAEKLRGIVSISIGFLFMLACLGIFISGRGKMEAEADSTSRVWCFQIDEEIVKDGKIQLTGFAFCYEQPVGIPKIILQSTDTGERVKLDMKYGLPRPDVNEYFLCGQDYTHVGFRASGEAGNGEYEVLIQWPRSLPISTGVFVGSSIHYAPKQEFAAPEIDAEFVRLGVLRVYRPKYHCWVYQYLDDLYWVVDPDFYFEDDGTTYIEYQISTTQIEKLPENRLANGYFWDDIGGYFEKYEMEGDWGKYRVMKREIPTAYSVTSIETGYYKNGEWIWREHFRPIYKFGR